LLKFSSNFSIVPKNVSFPCYFAKKGTAVFGNVIYFPKIEYDLGKQDVDDA
jgi:hypothetical protein